MLARIDPLQLVLDGTHTAADYSRESRRRVLRIFGPVTALVLLGGLLVVASEGVEDLGDVFLMAVFPAAFWAGLGYAVSEAEEKRLERALACADRRRERNTPFEAHGCPVCGSPARHLPRHEKLVQRHWRLNPICALAELFVGQRCARERHVCDECGFQYASCSSCGRTWLYALRDGRGSCFHWNGLSCPCCSAPLPTVRNLVAAGLKRDRGSEPGT
ncbi:MAG: hypothetical protein AB1486_06880 [Planctomycetota bacterium]